MRYRAVVFSMIVALSGAQGVLQMPAQAETSAWTMPKGDLQRTGASEASFVLPLSLIWRHSTDAKVTGRGLFSPLVVGPPGDRRVFFVAGRNLYCVNAQNGTKVWKSEDLASSLGAPLTLLSGDAGDAVLAITSTGRMTAFRTADGSVFWEADARGGIQGGAPTIVKTPKGERVLVVTSTGKVLAFQKDSGNLDPTYALRLGQGASAITSSPALSPDGSIMFLTLQDQKLYAIDVAKTSILYSVPMGKTSFETPVALGDRVFVAVGPTVRCFQQRSGNPLWTFNSGTRGRISASPVGAMKGAEGRVYAGTERGDFYALDVATGQKLWTAELGNGTNVGAATLLPDLILVGTHSDVLFGLRPSDGKILWQYRVQSQRVVTPADPAAPPAFGAAGEGGEGAPAAQAAPAAEGGIGAIGVGEDLAPPVGTLRTYGVSAAPVAVDGQIFVLADNAALLAFESTPFDAEPPYPAEPSLALFDAEKKFTSYLLDPDEPMVVPGAAPLVFAVQLSDPGSGVVPESIKVLVNAQAVSGPARVDFQPGSGTLSVNLIEAKPGQRPVLPDGVYTVAVSAKDYAGNELAYSGTFTVERGAPPPKKKVPDPLLSPGGQGMGFPGTGSPGSSSSGSSSSGGSSSGGSSSGSGSQRGRRTPK